MCDKCNECGHGANLINGRWCWKLMVYVEHCVVAPCQKSVNIKYKKL